MMMKNSQIKRTFLILSHILTTSPILLLSGASVIIPKIRTFKKLICNHRWNWSLQIKIIELWFSKKVALNPKKKMKTLNKHNRPKAPKPLNKKNTKLKSKPKDKLYLITNRNKWSKKSKKLKSKNNKKKTNMKLNQMRKRYRLQEFP